MKKLFGFLLLCATSVFVLSSCSSDDDEFAYPMESLYGTWDGTAVKMDGRWLDITSYWYEDLQFSITFYNNGNYYGRGYFGTGSGTYKAEGNYIYTYVGGKPYYNYRIKSLSNNNAELVMYNPDKPSSSLEIKVKRR